ncbi:radical SAM protein [Candidatus Pacearchaeota archaeon]|nr:radical SAM protein [Candidatus Pacearchaeota archaeon]
MTILSSENYYGLGHVPIRIGAQLSGWDLTEEEAKSGKLRVVDFRAMSPKCPHDCFHCFTEKQRKTLSLDEIKRTIDQIAELGAIGINYLGEGEPTIDPDFFKIVEYTADKGLIPLVFTDAATRLRDKDLVRRLNDQYATICPKLDSLFDEEYQNWVVGDKKREYWGQRNEALDILMEQGFNHDEPTRLGFIYVVTNRNMYEVEDTLRHCRDNNLWIGFSWFLPTGRSGRADFDRSLTVSEEDKTKIRSIIQRVDAEYGFNHLIYNNFATHPCVEFMEIFGDGRVSPCSGNDTVVGNVKTEPLAAIRDRILQQYPCHRLETFDGHCLYRPKIEISGGK